MTELHEKAMVQLLLAWAALVALVGNRVTWDSEEIDIQYPAVTLRALAAQISARELQSRGGMRRCLVEVSAHASTSTGSSQLLDIIVAALTPMESGPSDVTVGAELARFASVHLDDVTQSIPARERAYRKAARFLVTIYE